MASPSSSSSSSSSTSTCNLCIACADAGIPAAPVVPQKILFAGRISINPGNFSRNFSGNASNNRRILRGRGFRYAKANLAERAAIADRPIDICEPVEAPDYRSYNQPGGGNIYSLCWSFNYAKRPTCGSCDWKVTDKQANVVYTTEHV